MLNQLAQLHRLIIDHYDLEELRTLCFDVGVDFDSLRGEAKQAKARELILQLGRQRRLEQLLAAITTSRPDLSDEVVLKTDPAALRELYAALSAFSADVRVGEYRRAARIIPLATLVIVVLVGAIVIYQTFIPKSSPTPTLTPAIVNTPAVGNVQGTHINHLWFGIQTKNIADAGTHSLIVLIVNQHGRELLQHTFQDSPQADLEAGPANLYDLSVETYEIVPEMLGDSSIRVAIRGDDLWLPRHFVVWGERYADRAVLPLAMETDLGSVGLSTDDIEGYLSYPIQRVLLGSPAMKIERLLILMTTAQDKEAGTNDQIRLQINSGGTQVVDFGFVDTPQDDQERSQANLYFAPVIAPFTRESLDADSTISLTIQGDDGWLLDTFFIFGLDTDEGRPQFLIPLVHLPSWTLGWLSSDRKEGEPSVSLPLY